MVSFNILFFAPNLVSQNYGTPRWNPAVLQTMPFLLASALALAQLVPTVATVAPGAPMLHVHDLQSVSRASSVQLVANSGLLAPASRRGAPYDPNAKGVKVNAAKGRPEGHLAEMLGTTDIPIDVMATFGGLGFLWGHARAKLGKAATWGAALLIGGLILLSKNGYITIHWDKVQRDCMGTTTYRYNDPRKHGLLATIPPAAQERASRAIGKVQAAIEHNLGGIMWGVASLLIGIRLGSGSAEMPM